jgi:hypothetical protein
LREESDGNIAVAIDTATTIGTLMREPTDAEAIPYREVASTTPTSGERRFTTSRLSSIEDSGTMRLPTVIGIE